MTSHRTRARMVTRLREQGIGDERVLAAMERVPRHRFLDEALASRGYEDTALPIGWGQTLSRPWEVARMTEALLEVVPDRVLEVGAGSGYQSAVLAELVGSVWGVELVPELAQAGSRSLRRLGYTNVRLRAGDGRTAWAHKAPFDAVLVAASAEGPPWAILEQVDEGGIVIAPVGEEAGQQLVRWRRTADGFLEEGLGPCHFVPLRSETAG